MAGEDARGRLTTAQSFVVMVTQLSEAEIIEAGQEVAKIHRVSVRHTQELTTGQVRMESLVEHQQEFIERLRKLLSDFEGLVVDQAERADAAKVSTEGIQDTASVIRNVANNLGVLAMSAKIEAAR